MAKVMRADKAKLNAAKCHLGANSDDHWAAACDMVGPAAGVYGCSAWAIKNAWHHRCRALVLGAHCV